MTVYGLLLVAHGWLRWAVLALGIALVGRAAHGWRRQRPWTAGDERHHVAFVAVVDAQLLLGAWLYLRASPITSAFLAEPRAAMKITALRFFGLEHVVMMVAAVAVIHVGRARSQRAERHRRTSTWTGAAMLLILAGIPWPFLRHGRPLARALPASTSPQACPQSYRDRCAACHGERGRGDGTAAPSLSPRPRDFSDPSWWADRRDEDIAAIVRDGGSSHGLSAAMPANRDLTADQVTALVSCIRSFPDIR